ncbi:bifunctional diguanylate cyclase/phosphodiesterase [Thiomicrorhabdus chilensis]|uniref:bifunctional diguanylate cyclase/phosphodiesterase n=1 Tax=Thiomicrorhabdus chilensis TaxID=63656 RepID=UPI00041C6683|nr:EAL domain-containing protein [Thiomicrorhabdus chilensis]
MSLNKQMVLFIASMLLILLIGTFALNLSNTKHFLQEQLSSHAQDTATSLGLSLSSNADPDDISTMETMINAVFDRGYYSNITLTDMDGKILYERINPQQMEAVPAWFIESINLQTPTAEAIVQAGWIPIGMLNVTSHPGYAYTELWKAVINLSIWFAIAALLAVIVIVSALRIMLKPLKAMEQQAEAIVKKEYLLQDDLPNTTEFRQVVRAMNAMVQKMKDVFDRDAKTAAKLQKMAYQDSVTGLSNRRHFEMVVDTLLDIQEETTPGMITLVRVEGLKELNDQYGYLIGDHFMKQLADSLYSTLHTPYALLARLNGTEIVTINPGLEAQKLQPVLSQVSKAIPDALKSLNAGEAPTSVSIAYMDYQPGETRANLLSSLDYAIEQAREQGKNQTFYYSKQSDMEKQANIWSQLIRKAITEQRFVLYQQNTFTYQGEPQDKEVFIRLRDEDGVIHSAGYFMPAVEQSGKTAEIDKMVINLAFEHLQKHQPTQRLSINLTRSIVFNAELRNWLIRNLNTKDVRTSLAFELSEPLMIENPEVTSQFIKVLKTLGVAIGIDHFGSRFSNLGYLQGIKPDYVKLDSAFSKVIEQDEQTRQYVSSLCEMANSLDINVIALAVESQAQLDAFSELGVAMFQGYYYGAPTPLNEQTS